MNKIIEENMWDEWIGLYVIKRSKKPFKNGKHYTKVKGLTINPNSAKMAFDLGHSIVDCYQCQLIGAEEINDLLQCNEYEVSNYELAEISDYETESLDKDDQWIEFKIGDQIINIAFSLYLSWKYSISSGDYYTPSTIDVDDMNIDIVINSICYSDLDIEIELDNEAAIFEIDGFVRRYLDSVYQ
jgi:hypothetical protein